MLLEESARSDIASGVNWKIIGCLWQNFAGSLFWVLLKSHEVDETKPSEDDLPGEEKAQQGRLNSF